MTRAGIPVLAFDIGGTRVKAGLVDAADGSVRQLATAPSGETLAGALDAAADLGRKLQAGTPCDLAAVCLPGVIDAEGNVVEILGKLAGAAGTDVRGILGEALRARVTVTHDSIAHGRGEASYGAGRGYRRVLVTTIGTGVGVTVFQDGVPIGPPPFGAGSLGGHIPISERVDGRADSNGRYDTIEALCMARRVVDYAVDAGGRMTSAEETFAANRAGDAAAAEGIATYRGHLARALVAMAHAYAPDVLVVGGGVIVEDNPLLPGMEDEVNSRLYGSFRVAVRPALLGDGAALAGLAAIALDQPS